MQKTGGFFSELGRRRILRTAAIYIVGAWVTLQASDLAFPGLHIPATAIRYVWIGVFALFPLALVLGWRFNFSRGRIVRNSPLAEEQYLSLNRADYVFLAIMGIAALSVCLALINRIAATRTAPEPLPSYSIVDSKSIAVLPFTNLSGEESNEPFTLGIHDDVLTHIAKISGIKVISRTSVERIDPNMSIPEIGRTLGVATVLEGGLQRSGDRVRINAQLIEAATDRHLWAETFDRELTTQNIFAIQTEIAAAITEKLRAALTPLDEANLRRVPTQNLQAFEAYLLGKQHMTTRIQADLEKAIEYFQAAIELDPGYALAYIALADTYMLLNVYGDISVAEMLANVEPALAKAMAIDDRIGAAYATLGLSQVTKYDYEAARKSFERAIELDPNNATSYHWYGDTLLSVFGLAEQALPLLEKARELDPLSPVISITLGEILQVLGRYDEAMAQFRRAIEIEPDFPSAYALIGAHYRLVYGRIDEAIRWFHKELAIEPFRNSSMLGMAYLDLGDAEKAAFWINRGANMHPDWFLPNSDRVFLHRYLGEEEQALASARRLLDILPGNNTTLVTLVNYARYEEAIELFAPAYPELACDAEPTVNAVNFFQAINLSLAYQETGDRGCSNRLLERTLEQLQKLQRFGIRGYGIADVEIYARLGKPRQALDALRQAIDQGWRAYLWVQGEQSPHMVSLVDNPEFKAIMAEAKADLDIQLRHVREMESSGELAPVP